MPIFAPQRAVANIAVDKNSTLVGTEPELNLIEGSNVGVTVTDNAALNRIDVTIAGVTTSYQQAILTSLPSSYWHLDETEVTTMADVNSLVSGTLQGTYTQGQASLISTGGNSVLLGSPDGRISLGSASYRFAGTLVFTWEGLVNVASDTAVDHVIVDATFTDGSGLQGYNLQLKDYGGSGGSLALTRYRNNVGVVAYSSVAVPLGASAHVAGTYDGLNSKVYVNGVLTATGATDTASVVSGTSTIYLGNNVGGTRPLRGLLDEVAVYSRALPLSEIQTHYTAI
jgi:hypothetical protein